MYHLNTSYCSLATTITSAVKLMH